MRLIIENKIVLKSTNIIDILDFDFLKQNSVYIHINIDDSVLTVIEQKIDLPLRTLTKVMQIIEWYSVEPLIIRWFPDPKFYMYTEDYFFKMYGNNLTSSKS